MKAFLAASLMLLPSIGLADCHDTAKTTYEMTMCAGEDIKAADKRLNALFEEIKARSTKNPKYLKLLADTKKKWEAFRDSETKLLYPRYGEGSIISMCMLNNDTQLTEDLIHSLTAALHAPEGDVCAARLLTD